MLGVAVARNERCPVRCFDGGCGLGGTLKSRIPPILESESRFTGAGAAVRHEQSKRLIMEFR